MCVQPISCQEDEGVFVQDQKARLAKQVEIPRKCSPRLRGAIETHLDELELGDRKSVV